MCGFSREAGQSKSEGPHSQTGASSSKQRSCTTLSVAKKEHFPSIKSVYQHQCPTYFASFLTSLTVLSTKSKRTVAAERAPQVHTRPSVYTRVIVAEMSLGRASWEVWERKGIILLMCPDSLFHQRSRPGG